jgi:uncharacterized protein involved in cysteine biosynthesis
MNLQLIQVIVGVILIYLLLSLLVTAIQEILAAFLDLRARELEKGIKRMLDDNNQGVLAQKFYDSNLIKYLSKNAKTKPSYLSAKEFSTALTEILSCLSDAKSYEDSIYEGIKKLPDSDTKSMLLAFVDQSNHNLETFIKSLEDWFNGTMDRVSGWYKRKIQIFVWVIGLVIAVMFNADTFNIYGTLSSNNVKSSILFNLASDYVNNNDKIGISSKDTTKKSLAVLIKETSSDLDSLNVISNLNVIGWNQNQTQQMMHPKGFWQGFNRWGVKLLGWILTAIAITLGAPFWFDLLSTFVHIRNAGKKPPNKTDDC